MRMSRVSAFAMGMGLLGATAVRGQETSPETIPNWTAPLSWQPTASEAPEGSGHRFGLTAQSAITSPLPFIPVTPCRIADTRGNGFGGAYGPPALAAGQPRNFTLTGQCSVPSAASGVGAVSLNVTVTNTQGPGFILIYPQGGSQPTVSTLNYVAGQTIANAAVVPLGSGGGVTVIAGVSGTDLILDTNGYYAGAGAGAANTFLGLNAGNFTMTGQNNTAIGYGALTANSTGSNNIALGLGAGSSLTTGSFNIDIGHPGSSSDGNTIRIGNGQAATFIAGICFFTSPNGIPVYINSNGQLGTNTSSRRFKEDIRDIGGESAGLMKLRPVAFRYRSDLDPARLRQYGLIAEEVAEVYPDLVVNDRDGSPNTVRYHLVNALLLNEVQKQHRTIEAQQVAIERQNSEIQDLKTRLRKLETLVSAGAHP